MDHMYHTHVSYERLGERALGCSIEILRDIYCICTCVHTYVSLSRETHTKIYMAKYLGGITWPKHAHAQSQFLGTNIIHLGYTLEQL